MLFNRVNGKCQKMQFRKLNNNAAKFLVAVILLGPSTAGCIESSRKNIGADTPQANEKVQYALKLTKGQSYYIRFISDEEFSGQNSYSHQRLIGFGSTFDVKSVDDSGNALADCTVKRIQFKQNTIGGVPENQEVDYDSSDPNKQTIPKIEGMGDMAFMHARWVRAFLGEKFTIRITPSGQIQEIMGLETLGKNLDKKLDRNFIKPQNIKPDQVNRFILLSFLPVLSFFPERPVGLGDSWTRTEVFTHEQREHTWTLKNRNAGVATIEIDTVIKYEKPSMEIPDFPDSVHSYGQIKIIESSGRIIHSKIIKELSAQTGKQKLVTTFEMLESENK